ncbi:DNA-binding protein [Rhodovulum sp. YEN HP10]|uniref:DNA-binding protein n=1 Tax=Rhodovulum sp. HP10 TaxID=3387397 RepID=UPI0039DF9FDA
MAITRDFAPRLMPAPQAAHYLGVSESTLRKLGIQTLPLRGKRLYDRFELDAFADSLARGGETDREEGACDRAFGVAS